MKKTIYIAIFLVVFQLAAMEKDTASDNNREFLSLIEAIMSGQIRVYNDSVEFADCVQGKDQRTILYACHVNAINKCIYESLHACQEEIAQEFSSKDYVQNILNRAARYSLKDKLIKSPQAEISQEELASWQRARLSSFMLGLDLKLEKRERALCIEGYLVPYERKLELLDRLENRVNLVMINRELYKAALASQEKKDINKESRKELHLMIFTPLKNDMEILRRECKKINENPLTDDCLQQ